jgi:hypothetical protein
MQKQDNIVVVEAGISASHFLAQKQFNARIERVDLHDPLFNGRLLGDCSRDRSQQKWCCARNDGYDCG